MRIEALDRLINRMKALPGVWFPSCAEMARHCLDNHPPRQQMGV
jgi:recombinational DNA repair protein RecR